MSRRTVANGLLALSVMASLIFGVVPAFAQTNGAQVRGLTCLARRAGRRCMGRWRSGLQECSLQGRHAVR